MGMRITQSLLSWRSFHGKNIQSPRRSHAWAFYPSAAAILTLLLSTASICGAAITVTTQSQLGSISTRSSVQTLDNVLIGGFTIQGTQPKTVLVRAIGPELAGVQGAMADPVLELHDLHSLIATNDNWQT